jgi:hypothetical protein
MYLRDTANYIHIRGTTNGGLIILSSIQYPLYIWKILQDQFVREERYTLNVLYLCVCVDNQAAAAP